MTGRALRPYGWRAKLGLIVPPTNSVNEGEWQKMLPNGITLHAARMPLHTDTVSEAGRRHLLADVSKAAGDVAAAGVDAVAYGCTAGSLILPLDWLTGHMTRETGIPAVATGPAIVQALRALGARRIAVATPYHDALNHHEEQFFAASGLEVLSLRGLGIGANGPDEYRQIAALPPQRIRDHALSAMIAGAEAMVLSCTDLPTLKLHEDLERELGIPLVSSNQATFWAALRAAGIAGPVAGWGLLLQRH